MNGYNLELSIYSLIVAVAIRIIAAFFYAIVVYRANKENGVKNGLIKLRRQMLITSVAMFIINTLGLALIIIRPFVDEMIFKIITDTLTLINSIGLLIVGLLLFKIYTQKFSPQEKEIHRKIADSEAKKRSKIDNQKRK